MSESSAFINSGAANIVAQGIATGGNLASNIFSHYTTQYRDREARRWAEEQQRQANIYNSPRAMMSRLKQAGLNPNLISGQPPSEASSVAPPSVSQVSYSNPFQDLPSNLMAYRESQANIDLINANKDGVELDNALKQDELDHRPFEHEDKAIKAADEHALNVQELENMKQQGLVTDQTLKQLIFQNTLDEASFLEQLQVVYNNEKVSEQELQLGLKQAKLLLAQTAYYDALKDETYSRKELTDMQTEVERLEKELREDPDYKQAQIDLIKATAKGQELENKGNDPSSGIYWGNRISQFLFAFLIGVGTTRLSQRKPTQVKGLRR